MQLSKLEQLALALIEVLADPNIDYAFRKSLRETYDCVEQHICAAQAERAQTPDAR